MMLLFVLVVGIAVIAPLNALSTAVWGHPAPTWLAVGAAYAAALWIAWNFDRRRR
jgi:hypothetical protein